MVFLEGLPLTPLANTADSVEWADIVILAVQASHIPALYANLTTTAMLTGASRGRAPASAAAALAVLLPVRRGGASVGPVRVVKTLNNVSAYTLLNGDPFLDVEI
ncbi:hypothetical protein GPECTOR_31g394 [Gonium pectorale]|uniref:Uncharacterized protein n=1 Tax=Gonium pectorale TaxID=33097 RepID=A0A150GFC7_GONPE|nr:hypothetical protein GPECTOR_31g394 [Gonium pectorale]|eukprot:KXZ48030.1 hypothetical protein GPECTOR_31g394 [Gonium pectorale]